MALIAGASVVDKPYRVCVRLFQWQYLKLTRLCIEFQYTIHTGCNPDHFLTTESATSHFTSSLLHEHCILPIKHHYHEQWFLIFFVTNLFKSMMKAMLLLNQFKCYFNQIFPDSLKPIHEPQVRNLCFADYHLLITLILLPILVLYLIW